MRIYVKVFQICLAKLKKHSSETLSSHTTILTIYRFCCSLCGIKALKPLFLMYGPLILFIVTFVVLPGLRLSPAEKVQCIPMAI